jgi:hypothetical protein
MGYSNDRVPLTKAFLTEDDAVRIIKQMQSRVDENGKPNPASPDEVRRVLDTLGLGSKSKP